MSASSLTILCCILVTILWNLFVLRKYRNLTQTLSEVSTLNYNLEKLVEQRTREIANQKMRLAQYADAEIKLLKNQLSPHFFFNTLQSVYTLIEERPKQASDSLISLAEIMRYYMSNIPTELIDVSKEVDAIKNYVQVEQLRLKEYDFIDLKIKTKAQSEFQIPPMVLLTLVENCFKFGRGDARLYIVIDIEMHVNCLNFRTANFVQASETRITSHKIGLENVRRQLDLVFPDGYQFSVQHVGDIFYTYLEIVRS